MLIPGTTADDVLTGTAAADTINALTGNDTINDFVGADIVNGGSGNDTIALAATSVDLNSATNSQIVFVEAVSAAAAAADVIINLALQTEGFVITGSAHNDFLAGGAGADHIDAGAGNDTIHGFAGLDVVNGGANDDTLALNATSTTLNIATDAQLVNVEHVDASGAGAGVVLNLSRQSEHFDIVGSGFADAITGTAADDTIQAGNGDDTINDYTVGDTVDGGGGNDTLILRSQASVTALNNADDSAISGVEAITVGSLGGGVILDLENQTEGFRITATSFADQITGGGDDDTIVGFIGTDIIDGGNGNDTIVLTTSSIAMNVAADDDIVNVEAVSAAGAKSAVTIDLSHQTEGLAITGSSFADTITGTAAANVIAAGAGNDIINGFTLGDEVDGGANDDRIVLAGTSIALNQADDDAIVSVERINVTGAAAGVTIDLHNQTEGFAIVTTGFADTITGGEGNDSILAGAGNDTISGFTGTDKIDGGAGIDTLVLTETSSDLNFALDSEVIGVEIVTATGAGDDVVINLFRQTESFTITGGAHNDTITGGTRADIINAGDGDDTINGFVGADTVNGGNGVDTLVLTATSKTLNTALNGAVTNVEAISAATATTAVTVNLALQTEGFSITGSNLADTITGSAGADTLIGGGGNDKLNGGLGDDTFVFNAGNGADTVTGFVAGAATDDKLDLSSFGFATTADVLALATDNGINTVIDFGGGDTITLLGVTKVQLHQDDFVLT